METTVTYTYAVDETKLRAVHAISGVTTTTDYCGNVAYGNNITKLLLPEEGYISLNDNKYHYYLKDHQGNNYSKWQCGGNRSLSPTIFLEGVFANTGNAQSNLLTALKCLCLSLCYYGNTYIKRNFNIRSW